MYARSFRLLWFLAISLGLSALTFLIVPRLSGPTLYAGDRMEKRVCRECGGSGKYPPQGENSPIPGGQCPACEGEGKVDVIVPGRSRPTLIKGVVAGIAHASGYDTYNSLRPAPGSENGLPLQGPQGVVDGAKVTVRDSSGKTQEQVSNGLGLFAFELAPGSYHLSASKAGYEPLESDFVVPVMTEPIWREKAHIMREPRSLAEAQSLYGLQALAILGKPGGERGALTIMAGTP